MNKLFKALNDPTRRGILNMLRSQDLTAGEIADAFEISKPSISHHLEILHQAELVQRERDGQFIKYSLNTTMLEGAANWLFELVSQDEE